MEELEQSQAILLSPRPTSPPSWYSSILSAACVLAGSDAASLREYARALKELAQEHQIFVGGGGGRIAREYIEKARALGASEMFCDTIGIGATKLKFPLRLTTSFIARPCNRRPMDQAACS